MRRCQFTSRTLLRCHWARRCTATTHHWHFSISVGHRHIGFCVCSLLKNPDMSETMNLLKGTKRVIIIIKTCVHYYPSRHTHTHIHTRSRINARTLLAHYLSQTHTEKAEAHLQGHISHREIFINQDSGQLKKKKNQFLFLPHFITT